MALIKFGPGIVDASGSIAGVVFAKNATSHYMRARTVPVNPRASSSKLARDTEDGTQTLIRAAIAQLSQQWGQVLTAAQRTAWELYASNVVMQNKLGEAIKLSGYNHYLRSNVVRLQNGEASINAGPVIFELPEKDPTVSMTIEVHEQRMNLTFDDTMAWCDEVGAFFYVWEGVPQNPQRTFFGGPYLGVKDMIGKAADPYTSPERFSNIHFLSAGQKVWYKFRIGRADGRLSEPFYAHNIVVAGPLP